MLARSISMLRLLSLSHGLPVGGAGRAGEASSPAYGRAGVSVCTPSVGADQDHVGAALREQAHGDDAGDLVDGRLERDRVVDVQAVYVEDQVAVVGDEALPQHGTPAQTLKFAAHLDTGHGDDFDGQRKTSQLRHLLAGITDAHEALRHGSHDLLAGLGAAAALDHGQRAVDLVGAVDIDRDVGDVVQVQQADAMCGEPLGGGFGRGHRADDALLAGCQAVDEEIGGGARADADDGAVLHVVEGLQRGQLLEFILGHGGCSTVKDGF